MYRVLPSKRRRNPRFYPSNVGSSLDLFKQCNVNLFHQSSIMPLKNPPHQLSLESGVNNPFSHSTLKSVNLFQLSSVQFSLDPSHQFSLESGANPFNHYSLKPLNLFIQSSVQSSPSLESLDLFNQSRPESLNPST
jgi:hypothetical protein